jgi:hypothetical protein
VSDLRVYLSFDLEHDRDLEGRLLAQARAGSDFAVASRSEAGEMGAAWIARVRRQISACDEVVVICGEHTDASARVSAELEIARQEHKPYLLLWGRPDSMCKKPRAARPDDGMYKWTLEILEHQLAQMMRQSRKHEVPESMKRQAAPQRTPHGA